MLSTQAPNDEAAAKTPEVDEEVPTKEEETERDARATKSMHFGDADFEVEGKRYEEFQTSHFSIQISLDVW